MREHHISVTRTARYVTLGDADRLPGEVWFVCHGYAQLAARFARDFEAIDDGSRLIVVPEALSRFYLDSGPGAHGAESGDTRVCVLGFSQGVATVCRWLARGRARASRLILWGATVPPEFDFERDAAALRDAELWLVAGTRDKFTTIERVTAERERLRAHDIPHRFVTFDGGHRLDSDVL